MTHEEGSMRPRERRIDQFHLELYRKIAGKMDYVNLRELSGLSKIPFPTVVDDFSRLSVAEVEGICKASAIGVLEFLKKYREYIKFLDTKAHTTVYRSEIVQALRKSGLERKDFLETQEGKWLIKQRKIDIESGKQPPQG